MPARAAASRTRLDLPIPASPPTNSTAGVPWRAPATARANRASSMSRSTNRRVPISFIDTQYRAQPAPLAGTDAVALTRWQRRPVRSVATWGYGVSPRTMRTLRTRGGLAGLRFLLSRGRTHGGIIDELATGPIG